MLVLVLAGAGDRLSRANGGGGAHLVAERIQERLGEHQKAPIEDGENAA